MEDNMTFSPLPFNCSYLSEIPLDLNITDLGCQEGLYEGRRTSNIIALVVNQVFYVLTFIIGISGNTMVIYVVSRFSKMQTVTNMYILNLALADEVFLLGIPFLVATSIVSYWSFGDIMCKLFMVTTSLNQFTSSLFLTIMSADRYMAVCHPITSPKYRTPMISRLVSLTAWSVSAMMIVPIFMYSNAVEISEYEISCNVFFPNQDNIAGQTIFTLYSFILSFGLPFTLIFIFYALVVNKLRSVGPKTKSREKKRSHRKVTKMVLTVILVYLFCWLPYWVNQLILIKSPPRSGHSEFRVFIFMFSSCLSYLNSAINPVLYAFLSDNFKKSFMKACSCICLKTNTNLQADNSMFPRRRRSEKTSRTPFTARDNQSRDGNSSACPLSKDISTGMTMTSRTPLTSQVPEEPERSYKNGRLLLEVPTIHNSQL